MTDYSYSALGGDCTYQDGGYTPTYGTSGGIGTMIKTLKTWTWENAVKQSIKDYEEGIIDESDE